MPDNLKMLYKNQREHNMLIIGMARYVMIATCILVSSLRLG